MEAVLQRHGYVILPQVAAVSAQYDVEVLGDSRHRQKALRLT